jgi:hypothetical protein
MANTPEERVTQALVLAPAAATTDLRVTQARAFAAINFPTPAERVTQADVLVTDKTNTTLRVTQGYVLVVARGVTNKPKVNAWGYSLDGHDYYVLRTATLGTLVLDLVTGQWSEWDSHGQLYWRPHVGINWLGMGKATANKLYGTNIVAGDDRLGILWMLDPTKGVDDGVEVGDDDAPYTRTVYGLVPQTMRQTVPDGAIYLTISLGQPSLTGAGITLLISDDWGKSYRDAGTVTIEPGNFDQEISWRALGLIRSPGRIYQLSDQGAAVRINYLERR